MEAASGIHSATAASVPFVSVYATVMPKTPGSGGKDPHCWRQDRLRSCSCSRSRVISRARTPARAPAFEEGWKWRWTLRGDGVLTVGVEVAFGGT